MTARLTHVLQWTPPRIIVGSKSGWWDLMTIADWEAGVPLRDKPPQARRSKMGSVRGAVRSRLPLHQMPDVLLVAEDGAVASLFEWNVGRRVS